MKFSAIVNHFRSTGDIEITKEWVNAMSLEDAKGLLINRFRNSFVSIECIRQA